MEEIGRHGSITFTGEFIGHLLGKLIYAAGVVFKPMTEDLNWTRTEFTYAQTVGQFVRPALKETARGQPFVLALPGGGS